MNFDDISARDLLEAAPDALAIVDETGRIVYVNGALERLFGYERGQILGLSIDRLVPRLPHPDATVLPRAERGDLRAQAAAGSWVELQAVPLDGKSFAASVRLSAVGAAGSGLLLAAIRAVPAASGIIVAPPLVAAVPAQASGRRDRAFFSEMSRLARKDPITGLPNRASLHDRLIAAIAAARGDGRHLAVLFLDLDRFKHVNDSLGHGVGDWLLESVALRLTESVGNSGVVSRQGGDEFVILLPDVQSRESAAAAAAMTLAAVTGAHRVGVHDLHVTASMGIAMYPDDGDDPDTLIKNADIAMYHAKEKGRDGFQFFTEDMNARVVERQALEGSLRRAVDHHEFVLHYQPKIDLESGAMIGAEALLRWQHPVFGLVAPERFVPIAEDTGLIVPIGRWVMREACRQAREWQVAGFAPLPVAVNVCALELRSPGFLPGVRRVLTETNLEPRYLEIELTESVLMGSAGEGAAVLRELKAIGLRIAIDDFGTGYSSLSYLTRFPIDSLKVDQSFVRAITADSEGASIITAVISMGKSLNHRVIAEGVETPQQLAFLKALHCEEGQGFHFSRPLVAGQFATLLAR